MKSADVIQSRCYIRILASYRVSLKGECEVTGYGLLVNQPPNLTLIFEDRRDKREEKKIYIYIAALKLSLISFNYKI